MKELPYKKLKYKKSSKINKGIKNTINNQN